MTTAALLACRARIESLESSLRIYRADNRDRYQRAVDSISNQLHHAYAELDRIECELSVKMEGLR